MIYWMASRDVSRETTSGRSYSGAAARAQADPDRAASRLRTLTLDYDLQPEAEERLSALLSHLLGAGGRAPTAVTAAGQAVDVHVADALVALELASVRAAARIADLGAGAGVPGLVLAAALPAAEVSLVESQQSKCAFIAAAAAAMRLRNAHVVCARVEEWADGLGAHDVVTARALASQPVVLEYAAPLLALKGQLVDWRGARQADEEEAALRAAEQLGMRRVGVRRVQPFAGAEARHLHVFEKLAETPPRFPRRAGVARRKPLGTI